MYYYQDRRLFSIGPESVWTQRLNRVNANVNVVMATADEQIRVSDRVKRELDRRRREGESYNDVLERVLEERDGGDFDDGFGVLDDETAEWLREQRSTAAESRKRRMQRLEDDDG